MSYEITAGMGASYYRRFATEISDLRRSGELTNASLRLSVDFLEDLDNIAKHFNQSRNTLLVDLLFSGLQQFQNDFAEECFHAGDAETLQAFIDARGHKVKAETIFERIREEGLNKRGNAA